MAEPHCPYCHGVGAFSSGGKVMSCPHCAPDYRRPVDFDVTTYALVALAAVVALVAIGAWLRFWGG